MRTMQAGALRGHAHRGADFFVLCLALSSQARSWHTHGISCSLLCFPRNLLTARPSILRFYVLQSRAL